jgi:glycerophosphoryl diester phosphodiesterase
MKLFQLKTLAILLILSSISASESYSAQKKNQLPKPKNRNTYVIAHRGAHIGIPENSLAAYQKAIDLGCDYVEVDARSTKDGVIVSVHNSTVDTYVKGVTGKINDFTLEEIKALDIGSHVGPEWKDTRIATMEEVMQLCQGKIGIYLDLKENLVEELVAMIKKYHIEQDVLWCIPASRMSAIKKVQELCPDCIPMPDCGNEVRLIPTIEKVQPIVVAPVMRDFSETYVKTAHAKGVKVFLDEDKGGEKEWDWILDLGTDGIQTDDPEALIKYIKSRDK